MKTFDKFFLVIFLLLQVNLFDVIDLSDSFFESIMTYSQKKILLVFVIIYMFLRFIFIKDVGKVYRTFTPYIITLILMWIAVIFGTMSVFNQSFISTFYIGYYFLIILLYFVFVKIFSTWDAVIDFVKIFSIFTFILSISKIIQSFALSKLHISILHLNSTGDFNTATQMKYTVLGMTRISSASDFVFWGSVLLLVCMSLNRSVFSNFLDKILLLINACYLIVVGQTRAYIMIFILLICLTLFIKFLRTNGKILTIFVGLFVLIPIIYVAYIGIQSILFSNTSRLVALSIRTEAIRYYFNNIFVNKWFEFGFARDDLYANMIHGQLLTYNYDDVGLVGFLGRFGLVGIVSLIILVISGIVNFIHSKNKYVSGMLIISVVGVSISLSLLDPQRIFYFSVILALLDFFRNDKSYNGVINDMKVS